MKSVQLLLKEEEEWEKVLMALKFPASWMNKLVGLNVDQLDSNIVNRLITECITTQHMQIKNTQALNDGQILLLNWVHDVLAYHNYINKTKS